nr:hypothetical protein [uncultured Flavobacterium sp.]
MITDKIKSLFNFIEYLHSNIDNFKSYNELIVELEFLKTEKNKLNPKDNYKDKLKFNELQKELESKFKLLQDNTANLIKAKAKELDVCNFDNEPNYSFNGVEDEIYQLKEEFKIEDLAEINKHKIQYLEYRNQAHKTFLSLSFFFNDLDRILKDFFDFFKDNKQNEFEAFETKTIIINNQSKAFELYSKGYKDFKFEVIENYSLPDLSNCVFDLTLQNLVDCGLSEKHTSELLENKGKYTLQCNEGNFFVSAEDNKVYTGIEFYRKTYFYNGKLYFPYNCPDIIPDYFDLALNEFKQKQAELLGNIYNDSDAFDEFIKDETTKTQTRIEAQKEYLLKHKHHKFESKENDIKVCEAYIQYLKRKKDEIKEPQQTETIKPDEKYKTQSLFKVGLLFAKGEMNKYFSVNGKNATVMNSGYTAPKIANELGNESLKKWILASINNYTPDKENGNKNIFNSLDMMTKIISHCEAENIPVDDYFKSRLPIE